MDKFLIWVKKRFDPNTKDTLPRASVLKNQFFEVEED